MIKKLEEEEIIELKNIQDQRNELIYNLGLIEFESINLENKKSTLRSKIFILGENEERLGTKLQEKYGDGSINIEIGEITTLD